VDQDVKRTVLFLCCIEETRIGTLIRDVYRIAGGMFTNLRRDCDGIGFDKVTEGDLGSMGTEFGGDGPAEASGTAGDGHRQSLERHGT
jgi:hypothetical protein